MTVKQDKLSNKNNNQLSKIKYLCLVKYNVREN